MADFKKNCIFEYDLQGYFVKTFGSQGIGDGQFNHPLSIKCGPDNSLWVVDRDNHRVQKFDKEGNFLFKFGKFGRDKIRTGCFYNPSDIAFDTQGCVYVTDELNSRVQKFDAQGNFICIFGKTTRKEGELSHPRGIAFDRQQRAYVTEIVQGYGGRVRCLWTLPVLHPRTYHDGRGVVPPVGDRNQ